MVHLFVGPTKGQLVKPLSQNPTGVLALLQAFPIDALLSEQCSPISHVGEEASSRAWAGKREELYRNPDLRP